MDSVPAHSELEPDPHGGALSGDREEGAALILTVIVLTILIVLVVQFAFSVNRESVIVRNTQDDAAMELAARGIKPWVEALFAEDRANGAPGGDIDTLADILFDPQAETARQIKVGDVDLTFEAEDAERRFPLPWLASSDEKKAKWAKAVLIRLITKLEIEGEAEGIADAIKTKIQTLAEAAKSGPAINGAPAPQPGGQPAEGAIQLRVLFSIDQLLDDPGPAPDPSSDPAQPAAQPPTGGAAAAAGGIDRLTLYGRKADEEKGIEGKKGLAPYVTTWDTAGINLNTALPEILFAILPEKDKTTPDAKNLWESADEIVEAIRDRRIDPDYAGSAVPADDSAPGAPASGGAGASQQGASRQWAGTAFEKPEELQSAEIHEKLAAIFTKPEGQAGQGGGGENPDPNAGGGGGGGASGGAAPAEGEEEGYKFQESLVTKSRIYFLRISAEMSSDVKNVYRVVLTRSKKDEIRILMVEEVAE